MLIIEPTTLCQKKCFSKIYSLLYKFFFFFAWSWAGVELQASKLHSSVYTVCILLYCTLFTKHKAEKRLIFKTDFFFFFLKIWNKLRNNNHPNRTPLFLFTTIPGVEIHILKADMNFKYHSEAELKVHDSKVTFDSPVIQSLGWKSQVFIGINLPSLYILGSSVTLRSQMSVHSNFCGGDVSVINWSLLLLADI